MVISTQHFNVTVHTFGNPNATPLLLLHGFLGSGNDWKGCAKTLQERYFVIAPDIPGHGATQPNENAQKAHGIYSMESVATTILAVLSALNVGNTYICGYSMGGRLALYLSICFPKRFRNAVICSATAGLRTEEERETRRNQDEKLAQKLETEPLTDFLHFWYNQALFASLREHSAFQTILSNRSSINAPEAAKSLRGMGTGSQDSLWEILSSNRLPITFVAGEKDAKFVALAQELHVHTPFSRLEILPRAGHAVHFEAQEDIVSLLKKCFL
jgi:2-succinyl-6-hydroxy-2,4-cyclohexadiene-1-carboxylate synthase